MSLTLSYGFTKPETNDEGPDLFPLLEDNWQKVNDHSHNGVNSALLPGSSIVGTVVVILASNFVTQAGKSGHYEQTITLPAGYSFDTTSMVFTLNTATKHRVHPGITKVSDSQYKITFSSVQHDLLVKYN